MSNDFVYRADRSNDETVDHITRWAEEMKRQGNPETFEVKIKHSTGNPSIPETVFAMFEKVEAKVVEYYERWLPDMFLPDQLGLFTIIAKSDHNRTPIAGPIRVPRPGQAKGPAEFKRWDCFNQQHWVGPTRDQLVVPREAAPAPMAAALQATPLPLGGLLSPGSLLRSLEQPASQAGYGMSPAEAQVRAQLEEVKVAQRIDAALRSTEAKTTAEIAGLKAGLKAEIREALQGSKPPKGAIEELIPALTPLFESFKADQRDRERREAEWRREDELRRRDEAKEQAAREERERDREEKRQERERDREEKRQAEERTVKKAELDTVRENYKLERERDREYAAQHMKMLEGQTAMITKMGESSYQSTIRMIELQQQVHQLNAPSGPSPTEQAISGLTEAASQYLKARAFTMANPPPTQVQAAQGQVRQDTQQAAPQQQPLPPPQAQALQTTPPMRGVVSQINMQIRNRSPQKQVASVIVDAFLRQDADLSEEVNRHNGSVDVMLQSRLGDWLGDPQNKQYMDELIKVLEEAFKSQQSQQSQQSQRSAQVAAPSFPEKGVVVTLMDMVRNRAPIDQTSNAFIAAYEGGSPDFYAEARHHRGDLEGMVKARMTEAWLANSQNLGWLRDTMALLEKTLTERTAAMKDGKGNAQVAPPNTPHPADA